MPKFSGPVSKKSSIFPCTQGGAHKTILATIRFSKIAIRVFIGYVCTRFETCNISWYTVWQVTQPLTLSLEILEHMSTYWHHSGQTRLCILVSVYDTVFLTHTYVDRAIGNCGVCLLWARINCVCTGVLPVLLVPKLILIQW